MSFWDRFKESVRRFMVGRNGVDELSHALVMEELVVILLSLFWPTSLISLIGMLLAVYTLFRIFSRNTAKRRQENDKYIAWRRDFSTTASQSWNRLKNIRKYKYFKCPECHAMLRLSRKVGEVTVTCGKCKHQFKMKA